MIYPAKTNRVAGAEVLRSPGCYPGLRSTSAPATPTPRVPIQISPEWLLTPERAAVHIPTATAIIADLHLGYDLARCQSGEAVPILSLEDQWTPLETVISCDRINRLIVAGDFVEESNVELFKSQFKSWLRERSVELVTIVAGNHDHNPEPTELDSSFEGGCSVGDWQIVHGDKKLPGGKVVLGHHHPSFRWNYSQTAPCFLFRDNRLVLPAFSQDAAGGNVRSKRRWRGYRCYVIAGMKVLDFGKL